MLISVCHVKTKLFQVNQIYKFENNFKVSDKPNCSSCDHTNCSLCDGDICLISLKNCQENEYYNLKTFKCEKCGFNCAKCISNSKCTECNLTYKLVNQYCVRNKECQKLSGTGNYSSNCLPCPDNCAFCDLHTFKCSVCNNGYFLHNNSCQKCMANCLFCKDQRSCMRCKLNYQYKNSQCIKINPERMRINSTKGKEEEHLQSNKDLLDSTSYCDFSDSSNKTCMICAKGFYLGIDNTCKSCSSNCLFCRNQDYCLKCEQGYNLEYIKAKRLICVSKEEVSLLSFLVIKRWNLLIVMSH